MEHVEQLPLDQTKRTVVASLVALVIGAAAATGIWALADDDSTTPASAGSSQSSAAGVDNPGSQYGTSQYSLPPEAGAVAASRAPYGTEYRYPHP
jgi:hypothetical protein